MKRLINKLVNSQKGRELPFDLMGIRLINQYVGRMPIFQKL
jgi:hypothetical protein